MAATSSAASTMLFSNAEVNRSTGLERVGEQYVYPLTRFLRGSAAKIYQFLTRFKSGSKYWVFSTRVWRMSVGFFNRYKLQGDRTNRNVRSGGRKAEIRSSWPSGIGIVMECTGRPHQQRNYCVMGAEDATEIRVGKCPGSRKADED